MGGRRDCCGCHTARNVIGQALRTGVAKKEIISTNVLLAKRLEKAQLIEIV